MRPGDKSTANTVTTNVYTFKWIRHNELQTNMKELAGSQCHPSLHGAIVYARSCIMHGSILIFYRKLSSLPGYTSIST